MPSSVDAGALSGKFGRYEIVRLLGKGGMGAVYLAKDATLGRDVVIKVILPDQLGDLVAIQRFEREARLLAGVSSDHVVMLYDAGVQDGIRFLALQFVEGPSVAQVLREKKLLQVQEATRIVLEAARGLAAAHEKGILHRDVKPANLLVAKDGKVKVSDFGLARRTEGEGRGRTQLTELGYAVGTVGYMSPEQISGESVDGRADIYSLGVTYYELLSGTLPYQGKTPLETLELALGTDPEPLRKRVRGVPPSVEKICHKLFARDVAERPATMREAVTLLEDALERAGRAISSASIPSVTPETAPTVMTPVPTKTPSGSSWQRVPTTPQDPRGVFVAPLQTPMDPTLRRFLTGFFVFILLVIIVKITTCTSPTALVGSGVNFPTKALTIMLVELQDTVSTFTSDGRPVVPDRRIGRVVLVSDDDGSMERPKVDADNALLPEEMKAHSKEDLGTIVVAIRGREPIAEGPGFVRTAYVRAWEWKNRRALGSVTLKGAVASRPEDAPPVNLAAWVMALPER